MEQRYPLNANFVLHGGEWTHICVIYRLTAEMWIKSFKDDVSNVATNGNLLTFFKRCLLINGTFQMETTELRA